MFGGPCTNLRQFTVADTTSSSIVLSPAQLVDGVLVIADGAAPFTFVLPTVTALNAFLNSRLITSEPATNLAVTQSAPRTMFSFRIICNVAVNVTAPAPAPPGHATSGYNTLVKAISPADAVIGNIAAGATFQLFAAATIATLPRAPYEILFVQTAGPSSDPEWLICFVNQ